MTVDRAMVRERKIGHPVDLNSASSDDPLAIAGEVEVGSTRAERTHSARSLRAESCEKHTFCAAVKNVVI
jgi:hypothetical protein